MSNDLKRLLEIAIKAVPEAEWVGLRKRSTEETMYFVRDGHIEQSGTGSNVGCMVEVLYKGQFGYAATSDMSVDSIKLAAEKALLVAKSASPWAIYKFDTSVRPGTVARYESPRKIKSGRTAASIVPMLIDVCNTMKCNDKIVQTLAANQSGKLIYEIVTSNGAEIEQTIYYQSLIMEAIAMDGPVVQRRTDKGPWAYCYQGGIELVQPGTAIQTAKKIGEQAVELLSAPPCPEDTRTLVLAPDQMMLQIHESVGHPLEIDRILGDERNYAGSSFIKLSDIGTFQYGSKLMNITFDPTVPGELASYKVDEIGNPATKEFIVKDGILVRALGSLESQKRANVPGVANQRATSWNRPPIDRMANINLEPGTSTFDEIIGSIEKGIYMMANRSWSIDDYRNKFQFGCEYAKLIENGKLTKTVRDPNYRGISSNFWRNLVAVGNRDTFEFFGTPNCGKGEPNQVMYVGHGSPVCAFKDVAVFGGGK